MKILFVTNVPSPYRVLFFNELGKHCDLTVLYQRRNSSERDAKWQAEAKNNYRSVFMKGINTGVDNAFCPEVVKYLMDKSYDRIVICGIASPTEMLAILWCKFHHQPYCIESDGGFAKDGIGLKEKIKKLIVRGAELYFSTGAEHDGYYQTYGAKKNRIVRYHFSSLEKKDVLDCPMSKPEKMEIRSFLGMGEERIIISVGRFSYMKGYGKGYDTLLRAAENLPSDYGIYIIGDEPTEEFSEWKRNKNLTNVHFVGFKTKKELVMYYKAADVFVLMTRGDVWGLVINEAMSYGLPVITTNRCIAGMEMIDDGVTGYILPVGDHSGLIAAITNAVELDCAEECLKTARAYTIEEMVKDHISVFELQEKKV